jgi:hypothetical protein
MFRDDADWEDIVAREAGKEGSDNDLIKEFREKYRDQSALITTASQGDSKALRRSGGMWAKDCGKVGYRAPQNGHGG